MKLKENTNAEQSKPAFSSSRNKPWGPLQELSFLYRSRFHACGVFLHNNPLPPHPPPTAHHLLSKCKDFSEKCIWLSFSGLVMAVRVNYLTGKMWDDGWKPSPNSCRDRGRGGTQNNRQALVTSERDTCAQRDSDQCQKDLICCWQTRQIWSYVTGFHVTLFFFQTGVHLFFFPLGLVGKSCLHLLKQ